MGILLAVVVWRDIVPRQRVVRSAANVGTCVVGVKLAVYRVAGVRGSAVGDVVELAVRHVRLTLGLPWDAHRACKQACRNAQKLRTDLETLSKSSRMF